MKCVVCCCEVIFGMKISPSVHLSQTKYSLLKFHVITKNTLKFLLLAHNIWDGEDLLF